MLGSEVPTSTVDTIRYRLSQVEMVTIDLCLNMWGLPISYPFMV